MDGVILEGGDYDAIHWLKEHLGEEEGEEVVEEEEEEETQIEVSPLGPRHARIAVSFQCWLK